MSGSTIGTLIAFAIYAFAAVFAFPAGHAIAAIVLPSPILYFVWGTGMAEMALMGILLAGGGFTFFLGVLGEGLVGLI